MRRKITVIIIIVLCFLLQSTLFKSLSIASISPNLLIVVVSAFGFMRGRKEGMIIGFFCGLLIDIFFGTVIGFYALVYMYIGYLNGIFRKIFFPEDIKLPLILIASSDFILNLLVFFFMFLFRGQGHFGYYLAHIIIPDLLYTTIVALVLYFILLKVNSRLEEIEKRSASKFV